MVMQQGGINDLVNQKADAYRNNPQVLEKRYQQNQQLLDLLALQKVKSDKEAAARDMQLKMDQNPNTIAQQREQEVLAMTKDDMAKQTSGILGQRQKQQQKNMQRTAKGQGIPAARPPQMAAQGGIMGYAHGGEHNEEDNTTLDDFTDLIKENALELGALGLAVVFDKRGAIKTIAGKGWNSIKNNTGGVAKKIKDTLAPLVSRKGPQVRGPDTKISTVRGGESVIKGPMIKGPREFDATRTLVTGQGLGLVGSALFGGEEEKKEKKEKLLNEEVVEEETKEGGGLEIIPEPKSAAEQARSTIDALGDPDTSTASSNRVSGGIKPVMDKLTTDRLNVNPNAASLAARTDSDSYMRRDENRAALDKEMSGIEAFRNRQLDPEKLRREGLRSVLTGIGQRGLVGGAIGAAQADQQVQGFERTMRQQAFDNRKAQISQDIDVGKIGQETKQRTLDTLTKSQDEAMAVLANVSQADVERLDAEVDRINASHQRKIDNQLSIINTQLEERKIKALENRDRQSALLDLLALKEEANQAYQQALAISAPEYDEGKKIFDSVQGPNIEENIKDLSDDDYKALQIYTAAKAKQDSDSEFMTSLEDEIKNLAKISNSASYGT